ncbi:hypermethylated in cancer 2 [Cichlidogyrus casuarinus]|uniref:Hypermethylated in cancer 2 n=1 Tax=Cichlidogyrus casuarinus TaxID=1844966 RepID=A0ABD2Q473_9PLAT
MQLWQQLVREEYCDVSITIGETAIKAHRNILAAASGYFKKAIALDPNNIPLPIHMDDPTIVRQVIQYIYTGSE